MAQRSFVEFTWGLAKSEHYFLWIVRPDVVVGSDSATLPEEFYEEVKDRGLIAKWCPQERVLSHSSVGAFLTHCGWNSTLNAAARACPLSAGRSSRISRRIAATRARIGGSEWKREAVEATDIGGSSRIDFDKLIMEGFSTYNG